MNHYDTFYPQAPDGEIRYATSGGVRYWEKDCGHYCGFMALASCCNCDPTIRTCVVCEAEVK